MDGTVDASTPMELSRFVCSSISIGAKTHAATTTKQTNDVMKRSTLKPHTIVLDSSSSSSPSGYTDDGKDFQGRSKAEPTTAALAFPSFASPCSTGCLCTVPCGSLFVDILNGCNRLVGVVALLGLTGISGDSASTGSPVSPLLCSTA